MENEGLRFCFFDIKIQNFQSLIFVFSTIDTIRKKDIKYLTAPKGDVNTYSDSYRCDSINMLGRNRVDDAVSFETNSRISKTPENNEPDVPRL